MHISPAPGARRRRLSPWIIGLALSVVGVAAAQVVVAPAFASTSPTGVTFKGATNDASVTEQWTVGFTPTTTSAAGSVTVAFPSAFTVPSNVVSAAGSGWNGNCKLSTSSVSGTTVTISIVNHSSGSNSCLVSGTPLTLTLTNITNPVAGTYPASGFTVATSADVTPASPAAAVMIYGLAANGAGTMTVSPGSVAAGSSNALVFTFTAPTSPTPVYFPAGSNVTLTVPSGWTAPTTTNSVAGGTCAEGTLSVSGSVITVPQTCTAGQIVTITYTATAPTATGSATFAATSQSGSSGGTALTAGSPAVSVTTGAAAKLAFVQPPTNGYVNVSMTPAVTVQVEDTNGNPVSDAGVTVALSSTATISAGGSATTSSTGLATFSGLQFNTTWLGVTLTASATNLASVTSGTFNVTVHVTSTTNALTSQASDAGSGVGSVAYYYCSGLSGACTSSNWTPIGSSSTGSGNFAVTWSSLPASGAYQVVQQATDNVGNLGTVSAGMPVTVN